MSDDTNDSHLCPRCLGGKYVVGDIQHETFHVISPPNLGRDLIPASVEFLESGPLDGGIMFGHNPPYSDSARDVSDERGRICFDDPRPPRPKWWQFRSRLRAARLRRSFDRAIIEAMMRPLQFDTSYPLDRLPPPTMNAMMPEPIHSLHWWKEQSCDLTNAGRTIIWGEDGSVIYDSLIHSEQCACRGTLTLHSDIETHHALDECRSYRCGERIQTAHRE